MCPDEGTLIRCVAGELSAQERAAQLEHIANCPACRQKYAELEATWQLTGLWELPEPSRDLSAAIMAAARRGEGRRWWSSVAAAVLLAAGAGVGAGLLVPASPRVAKQGPTEIEVAEAIGIDALADSGGGGLNELFTPPGHEEVVEEEL